MRPVLSRSFILVLAAGLIVGLSSAEIYGATLSVAIHNPYCYQPVPSTDACYINWELVQGRTDATMTSLTIRINDRVVAQFAGGGTQIDVPASLNPAGYKVRCGRLNVEENPDMGAEYRIHARAENSADMNVAWWQDIWCPAFRGAIPFD